MKNELVLGNHNITYDNLYNPEFLQKIPRSLGRASLNYTSFFGYDLWRCYEFSYLDLKGIPQNYILILKVDASSPYIVESKSLKLYLFSFSQTKFANKEDVIATIDKDLLDKLETKVVVKLYALNDLSNLTTYINNSALIDLESIDTISDYEVNPKLLQIDSSHIVTEALYTNMVKTLCPVTSQPDYATVFIEYTGPKIDRGSLLKYFISFRLHQGFHEQCIELIFNDLMQYTKCQSLKICGNFTRRGGIDINPIRSTDQNFINPIRVIRQ